jgi:hypothetical protein
MHMIFAHVGESLEFIRYEAAVEITFFEVLIHSVQVLDLHRVLFGLKFASSVQTILNEL